MCNWCHGHLCLRRGYLTKPSLLQTVGRIFYECLQLLVYRDQEQDGTGPAPAPGLPVRVKFRVPVSGVLTATCPAGCTNVLILHIQLYLSMSCAMRRSTLSGMLV